MTRPYYQSEGVRLYCGDAKDFVAEAEGAFLLTDPPYGLKIGKQAWHGNNGTTRLVGNNAWDEATPTALVLDLVSRAEKSVVWGGNFYPLPPSRCWLIWDKLQANRGAECEMAWTNLDRPPAVFRLSRIDAYVNRAWFKKVHPTEKPVQLSQWVLNHSRETRKVFDPFCGCGSTLLAARAAGRDVVGVEQNEEWCSEIVKRLQAPTGAVAPTTPAKETT